MVWSFTGHTQLLLDLTVCSECKMSSLTPVAPPRSMHTGTSSEVLIIVVGTTLIMKSGYFTNVDGTVVVGWLFNSLF